MERSFYNFLLPRAVAQPHTGPELNDGIDYLTKRRNTLYDHLEAIRQAYGYRNYRWPEPLKLARYLARLGSKAMKRYR